MMMLRINRIWLMVFLVSYLFFSCGKRFSYNYAPPVNNTFFASFIKGSTAAVVPSINLSDTILVGSNDTFGIQLSILGNVNPTIYFNSPTNGFYNLSGGTSPSFQFPLASASGVVTVVFGGKNTRRDTASTTPYNIAINLTSSLTPEIYQMTYQLLVRNSFNFMVTPSINNSIVNIPTTINGVFTSNKNQQSYFIKSYTDTLQYPYPSGPRYIPNTIITVDTSSTFAIGIIPRFVGTRNTMITVSVPNSTVPGDTFFQSIPIITVGSFQVANPIVTNYFPIINNLDSLQFAIVPRVSVPNASYSLVSYTDTLIYPPGSSTMYNPGTPITGITIQNSIITVPFYPRNINAKVFNFTIKNTSAGAALNDTIFTQQTISVLNSFTIMNPAIKNLTPIAGSLDTLLFRPSFIQLFSNPSLTLYCYSNVLGTLTNPTKYPVGTAIPISSFNQLDSLVFTASAVGKNNLLLTFKNTSVGAFPSDSLVINNLSYTSQ